jgi:hypothetical protein
MAEVESSGAEHDVQLQIEMDTREYSSRAETSNEVHAEEQGHVEA